jgi:hypothetical protein
MPLPHTGSFKKGDPRARAAGQKSRRGKMLDTAAIEAQASFERMILRGAKLPEGFEAPSTMEVQEMARALTPAILTFAAGIVESDKAGLSDKFVAAKMLMQYGGAALAVDAEELARLKALLEKLQEEHRASVAGLRKGHAEALKALQDEAAAIAAERDRLRADLDEARSIKRIA